MSKLYRACLKKILFCLPPETAHHVTLQCLQLAHRFHLTKFFPKIKSSPLRVMGLDFSNPIGIAAGLDKNGDYIAALASLRLGFLEIGTVTPLPQPGNDKPRLFRLEKEEAIINRFGFNNKGVDFLVEKLKKFRKKKNIFTPIIGANIVKNLQTSLENAVDDYVICFRKLAAHVDYITINISSPNTKDLRQLQNEKYLKNILQTLKREQAAHKKYVPLVVKISPDMSHAECAAIAEIFLQEKIDGIIATNTSKVENGGLSGKPLTARATEMVKLFHELLQGKIPIIASGGVVDAESAQEKFLAGATLVQVYSGLVYRGWGLAEEISAAVAPALAPAPAAALVS